MKAVNSYINPRWLSIVISAGSEIHMLIYDSQYKNIQRNSCINTHIIRNVHNL